MKKNIDTKSLLLRIFIPSAVFTLSYFVLGHFCHIPKILLFCILGTFILVPMELGMILKASKSEFGKASLKSAILFSLYHLWVPFQNVYRILAFAPMAYVTYQQKNLYISILYHCLCNIMGVIWFVGAILQ